MPEAILKEASLRRHGNTAALPALRDAPDEMLLTTRELGALTNNAEVTIRLWHRENRGPKRILVEGRPRYMLRDVRTWLQSSQAA